jgi:hypothetical protein
LRSGGEPSVGKTAERGTDACANGTLNLRPFVSHRARDIEDGDPNEFAIITQLRCEAGTDPFAIVLRNGEERQEYVVVTTKGESERRMAFDRDHRLTVRTIAQTDLTLPQLARKHRQRAQLIMITRVALTALRHLAQTGTPSRRQHNGDTRQVERRPNRKFIRLLEQPNIRVCIERKAMWRWHLANKIRNFGATLYVAFTSICNERTRIVKSEHALGSAVS